MRTSNRSLLVFRIVILCIALLFAFAIATSFASDADLNTQERSDLLTTLSNAETDLDGKLAENELWTYWFELAPTPAARTLIDGSIELS